MQLKTVGISIILFFGVFIAKAQVITYTNLSKKYVYKIKAERVIDSNAIFAKTKLNLFIYQHNRLIQTITFKNGVLFNECFTSDTASRSYITGKNRNKEIPDYDFGDIIIADLNFDGKEDIAIKYDSGGNGGPIYNFYIQQPNGIFKRDYYLTNNVGSFPEYINIKHKTITTQIHANVHQEAQKTFKYNLTNKKWRLIKWKMVEA